MENQVFASASDYIDLNRYPLDRPDSDQYAKIVSDAASQLSDDGCCVLKGFIRQKALPDLVRQADLVAPHAHRSFNRTNPYFSEDDPDLPSADPRRRFYDRSNAFVPADNFGPETGLRAIYEYDPFQLFIKRALGADRFFRYADPLADVISTSSRRAEGSHGILTPIISPSRWPYRTGMAEVCSNMHPVCVHRMMSVSSRWQAFSTRHRRL